MVAMNVHSLFEQWRENQATNWGLAWYLSNECCKRFYGSHGIAPRVLDHEGLGYYGIMLERVPCSVNGPEQERLGRFTIAGDVENWRTGSPGDHRLKMKEHEREGVPTEDLVREALHHLALPAIPERSHVNCRHKRWSGSFELMHEMATIIALRRSPDDLYLWNHDYHTKRIVAELDSRCQMHEHPGAYLLRDRWHDRRCVVTADGRLLGHPGDNYWERYMAGESIWNLALDLERRVLPDEQ